MPTENPDDLLRPREAAEIFGVRTSTIARWAREGKLTPLLTPGGHRRYARAGLQDARAGEPEWAEDAVRLYNEGWSIRQVAERFECGYGVMRRVLSEHVPLRNRGGASRA